MINNFSINNYKKFDQLELTNLKLINIITGDNNSGKTCLLESLCLDGNIKNIISHLNGQNEFRGGIINFKHSISNVEGNYTNNLLFNVLKNKELPIIIKNNNLNLEIKNTIIDIKNSDNVLIKDFILETNLFGFNNINELSQNWLICKDLNKNKIVYLVDLTSEYYKDFMNYSDYISFIPINLFYNSDIVEFFQKVSNDTIRKTKIFELLNTIFQINIIDIRKGQNEILEVATNENPKYHSITNFGSGFIKTFRIVLELYLNKGKYLCIDELDAGIHFMKQEEIFGSLIKISKELDVQLFITTHSNEAIGAYLNAVEKNNFQHDFTCIQLLESRKDNEIYSSISDFELTKLSFDNNNNLRGGW
jgi:AAA15 family ATPase/GTPase